MKMAPFHLMQDLLVYWPAVTTCLVVVYLLRMYFNRGLNRYPGPLLANFTDAWRWWYTWRGKLGTTMIKVHERYCPVVRTGPNTIEIADSTVAPHIYGVNKGFQKTDFYDAFQHFKNGRLTTTIFPVRDEQLHTKMRRPVAAMFSLRGLTEYEPLVDEMIRLFADRLSDKMSSDNAQGPFDLGTWFHCLATDTILNLTLNHTWGFLEHGTDIGGFMEKLAGNIDYGAIAGQMPWTRYLWRHNPILAPFHDSSIFPAFVQQQAVKHKAKIAAEAVQENHQTDSASKQKPLPGLGAYGEDFLTRFLKLPDLPEPWAISVALSAVAAGSDTVGAALCNAVYLLLSNPPTLRRLLEEIQSANLSFPVTWKESQQMPYLRAVIEESHRLRPVIGMAMLREVPAGPGLSLADGSVLPSGTAVGMNPWPAHRDGAIFGPLPTDEFRPERWLPAEGEQAKAYEARVATMRRFILAFGYAGSKRVCIGRHIAALEIYKLIPSLFAQFNVQLDHPERKVDYVERFVAHPKGLICRIKQR